MKSPKGVIYSFNINKFLSFNITHKEIWGEGIYVCSSDFQYDENNKEYMLEIILNSGDQIIAYYK